MIDYDKLKEKFKADFAVQFPDDICDWFMDEIGPLIQVQPTVELFSIEMDGDGNDTSLGMFDVSAIHYKNGKISHIAIKKPEWSTVNHLYPMGFDNKYTNEMGDTYTEFQL